MEHTPSDISMTWEEDSTMTPVLVKCYTKEKKKTEPWFAIGWPATLINVISQEIRLPNTALTSIVWNLSVYDFHVDFIKKKNLHLKKFEKEWFIKIKKLKKVSEFKN